MAHVSDIKLIRTDTTLDLSQKAEKGLQQSPACRSSRCENGFLGSKARRLKQIRETCVGAVDWLERFPESSLDLCRAKLGRCGEVGVFFGPNVAKATHIQLFVVELEYCLLESLLMMAVRN
ncbi:hypothetical protein DKX38_024783 [Salix brachista]|uniref:Uncharacterized protein n=1 Tax=Salix brachista TaxID=2182728 RepID=A0A5N5JR82_9ROSI|nr:hypothetical protein DKX38_024783 [Salix brachista]